jgi:CheY-like chemotaxis protein
MRHRFLVLGVDGGHDAAASVLGRAGHEAIVCLSGVEAVAIARRAPSAVLIVVAPPAQRATADLVASLSLDPATQSMPLFVVHPFVDPSASVQLLAAGVAAVVRWDGKDPSLPDRIIDVIGPEPGDAGRVWAAIDQRGPAVLRRIARFFTDAGMTGMVAIEGAGAPALVSFVDGDFDTAAFGGKSGTEAATALLAAPGSSPWSFSIEGVHKPAPAGFAPTPASPSPPPTSAHAKPAPAFEDIALDDDDDESLDFSVEDADVSPIEPLPRASAEALGRLPPLSILLVDDDPDLVTLYTRALSATGALVSSAADGEAGFRRALEVRPDVIVSDIMMPHIDGWGFLALVRADYRVRETPFVLFSCHGDYLSNLQKLSAGAEDYLAKGLRPSSLVERVLDVLDERRALQAGLVPGLSFSGTLVRVGPATLLHVLSAKGMTGTLSSTTRTSAYRIGFLDGNIVDAGHTWGSVEDKGALALKSFLTLDDANYTFVSGAPAMGGLRLFFPDIEAEITALLNTERTTHDETEVAADHTLTFERADLLTFYRSTTPDPARPILDALTSGVTPRGVLLKSDASPLLIEAVVKDLLRKGVARFDAQGPPSH